jgi:hypothetical protein
VGHERHNQVPVAQDRSRTTEDDVLLVQVSVGHDLGIELLLAGAREIGDDRDRVRHLRQLIRPRSVGPASGLRQLRPALCGVRIQPREQRAIGRPDGEPMQHGQGVARPAGDLARNRTGTGWFPIDPTVDPNRRE